MNQPKNAVEVVEIKSKLLIITFFLALFVNSHIVVSNQDLEKFVTNHLAWFGQSAFVITSCSGQILYIDPVRIPQSFALADVILVTHDHYDHFTPATINRLKKSATVVIVPESMIKPECRGLKVWRTTQAGSFKITAVPAYNNTKNYHPKYQNWLGYIIEVDGVKVYHAGDTDLIPEMAKLNIDIALLPIGGTYTMNVEEAVQATEIIKAKLYIPMHFGSIIGNKNDGYKFAGLVRTGTVKVLTPVY